MGIVEDFLKKGILVSPEVASRIDPCEIDKILGRLGDGETVLTPELYGFYRLDAPKAIEEYRKEEETKRINSFVDFYNKRFDFLRRVLADKVDQQKTTSINKLSSGETTVIGMVRDLRKEGFTLEDQTGSVFCHSDVRVIEDEVVAVRGRMERNSLKVEKIFHPDIPLSRKVKTTDKEINVLFTEKLTSRVSRESHHDYVFAFEMETPATACMGWLITKKSSAQKSGTRLLLNLPATVGIEELRILFFQYESLDELKKKFGTDDEKKLVIELLKRRHMLPFLYKNGDPYLLREIPDIIFFAGGNEAFFLNYKGISVVSVVGEGGFFVNLRTRDFHKVG